MLRDERASYAYRSIIGVSFAACAGRNLVAAWHGAQNGQAGRSGEHKESTAANCLLRNGRKSAALSLPLAPSVPRTLQHRRTKSGTRRLPRVICVK